MFAASRVLTRYMVAAPAAGSQNTMRAKTSDGLTCGSSISNTSRSGSPTGRALVTTVAGSVLVSTRVTQWNSVAAKFGIVSFQPVARVVCAKLTTGGAVEWSTRPFVASTTYPMALNARGNAYVTPMLSPGWSTGASHGNPQPGAGDTYCLVANVANELGSVGAVSVTWTSARIVPSRRSATWGICQV